MALPATEAFAGASGALGASWTQQSQFANVNRNGSGLGTPSGTATGVDTMAFWNADTFSADQYAQLVCKGFTNGSSFCGVAVRQKDTTDTAMDAYTFSTDGTSGASHTEIAKYVNGTRTALKSVASAFSVDDVIRIEVSGTTITAKKGSTTLDSTTDASLASGSAGIDLYWDFSTAPTVDDWEGGNLVAASAALTGTSAAGIAESDIVAGGKTIILTLTAETYVPSSSSATIVYVGGQVGGRAGSTSTSSVNFALSGGTDATPQAGDFVVITVVVGTAGRTPACAVSGYTALGRLDSNDTIDVSMDVSYKFMGGTPDTSFTLPSTGNIADAQRYTVQVFRNINTSTPLDVTAVSATGVDTTRCDPASITPTTSGAYVLICGGGGCGTGASYTAPTNYTTNFLTGSTADTNDAIVGSGYRAWTSGPEDPGVYGGGSNTTSDAWAAYTIALRPVTSTPFPDARAAIIAGLDSAQSETHGWDADVKTAIPLANVVRTSDTVVTITLPAVASYDITATETITATIPGTALTGGSPLTASPTFTITAAGGGGSAVSGLYYYWRRQRAA